MANNALTYIANLGKSVTYSAVDQFKEMNPAISDFASQNAELGKVLYESVKDIKGTIHKGAKYVRESQVGEFAVQYKKSLFEDIKTGKFYNRERIDQMDNIASGGLTDFGFMDEDPFAGAWDDDDSFSDNDDPWADIGNDDKYLAESMDLTGSKITQGVAMATAKSAEYVVASNKQGINALQKHNEFLINKVNVGLAGINSNISSLIEFNNKATSVHFENSKKFYETMTDLTKDNNALLKQLVDMQSRVYNNSMNSTSKSDRLRYEDIAFNGIPDLKQYAKLVGQNIKDMSGGLFDINGALGGNMLMSLAGSPLKGLTDAAVKKFIGNTMKKSMESFNETIKGAFPAMMLGINSQLQKESETELGDFLKTALKVFGVDMNAKRSINTSKYNKGPMPWDGESKMALTQVIPQLLSKILAAQTDGNEKMFDYASGSWTTYQDIKDKLDPNKIENNYADNAAKDLMEEVGKLIDKLDVSAEEYKRLHDASQEMFRQNYKNGTKLNFNAKTLRDAGYSFDQNLDEDTYLAISQMLKSISKNKKTRHLISNYGSNLLDSKTAQNIHFRNLEDNASSIDRVIYNNFNGGEYLSKKYDQSRYVIAKGGYSLGSGLSEEDILRSELYRDNNGKLRETREARRLKDEERDRLERERIVEKNRNKRIKNNLGTYTYGDTFYAKNSKEELTDSMKEFFDQDYERERLEKENKEYKNRKPTLAERLARSDNANERFVQIVMGVEKLANKPAEFLAGVLNQVDDRLYDFIYGDKRETGRIDTKSFMGNLLYNMTSTFANFTDYMKQNVFDPFKEAILGDKSLVDIIKNWGSNFAKKHGIDKQSVKDFILGQKDEKTGKRKGGMFGNQFGYVRDQFGNLRDKFGNIIKPKDLGLAQQVPIVSESQAYIPTEEEQAMEDIYDAQREEFDDIVPLYAGGTMRKTGLAVLSEGELVVPAKYNPFYKKPVKGLSAQRFNENKIKKNFTNYLDSLKYYNKTNRTNKDIEGFASGNPTVHVDGNGRATRTSSSNSSRSSSSSEEAASDPDGEWHTYADHDPMGFKVGQEAKNLGKMGVNLAHRLRDRFSESSTKIKSRRAAAANRTAEEDKLYTEMLDDVKGGFSKYAPGMLGSGILGAGVSLITGAVGGPLLGAAVGAATDLVVHSDKVQNWLFGEIGEDGKRQGNVLSKDFSQNIQKYMPDMAKGAVLGGITSILPFVPGGPVAGIILGSSIGFAKNNEKVQRFLFGNEFDEDSGLINKKMRETIKKSVPKMILGAGLGVIAGPFGLVGNMALGSGIALATQLDSFKDLLLGKENEDGKREGGIIGAIEKNVVDPLARAFDPITTEIKNGFKNIFNFAQEKISNIFEGFGYTLFGRKIKGAANKAVGGVAAVGKAILNPAFHLATSPFRMIGSIGDHFRKKQIGRGEADYMTAQQRLDYREELQQGVRYKRYKKDGEDEYGVYHKKGDVMRDAAGNPIIESNRSFKFLGRTLNRHGIKKDKFKEFDDLLVDASDNQLSDIKESLNFLSNPNDTFKKETNRSVGVIKDLLDQYNIPNEYAFKIMRLLKENRYDQADAVIAKIPDNILNRERKAKLRQEIADQFSTIKSAANSKTVLDDLKKSAFKKLESLGLKGINERNIDKYSNLVNKEELARKEYGMEQLNDDQNKRHEEIIDEFNRLTMAIRAIYEPELQKRVKKYYSKYYKKNANRKVGLFGRMGIGEHEQMSSDNDLYTQPAQIANTLGGKIKGAASSFWNWGWNNQDPETLSNLKVKANSAKNKFAGNIKAAFANFRNKDEDVRYEADENGNPIKWVRSKEGEWEIDRSDNSNKEILANRKNNGNILDKVAGKLHDIGSDLKEGFLHFFKIDEERDGWMKKILKIGLGVAGALTVAGFMPILETYWDEKVSPKIKNFWENSIQPKFQEWIEPIQPTIARAAVGLDNVIRSIPTVLDGLANKIKTFITEDLPSVWTNKIIPFYKGGIDWLVEKIPTAVENIVFTAGKLLGPIIVGAGKGLWNVLKYDVKNLFMGKGDRGSSYLNSGGSGSAVAAISNSSAGKSMSSFSLFSDAFSSATGKSASEVSGKSLISSNASPSEIKDYYFGKTEKVPSGSGSIYSDTGISHTSTNLLVPSVNANSNSLLNSITADQMEGYAYASAMSAGGSNTTAIEEEPIANSSSVTAANVNSSIYGSPSTSYNTNNDILSFINGNYNTTYNPNTLVSYNTAGQSVYGAKVDFSTGLCYGADGKLLVNTFYDPNTESFTSEPTPEALELWPNLPAYYNNSLSQYVEEDPYTYGSTDTHPLNDDGTVNEETSGRDILNELSEFNENSIGYRAASSFGRSVLTGRKAIGLKGIAVVSKGLGKIPVPILNTAFKATGAGFEGLYKTTSVGANINKKLFRSATNSVDDVSGEVLKKASKIATDETTGILAKFANKVKEFFNKIMDSKIVKEYIAKGLKSAGKESGEAATKEIAEKIAKEAGEQITETVTKSAAKAGGKGLSALGKAIPYINLIFTAADFLDGFTNAASYLGILDEDCTFGYRLACGFAQLVNGYLTLGFIPLSTLIDLFISLVAPIFGFDTSNIEVLRDECIKTINKYNEEHGTSLSVQEYNERDDIDKIIFGNIKDVFTGGKKQDHSAATNSIQAAKSLQNISSSYRYDGTKDGYVAPKNNLLRIASGKNSGIKRKNFNTAEYIKSKGLISQYDPKYSNMSFKSPRDTIKQSIKDAACGPAAAAMVINSTLGTNLTIKDTATFAIRNNNKVTNGGVDAKYFNDIYNKYGLGGANYFDQTGDIITAVASGRPTILMGIDNSNTDKTSSPFGPQNHYVVANGITSDGKAVYINDPEQSKNNVVYPINKIFTKSLMAITPSLNGKKQTVPTRFSKYSAAGSAVIINNSGYAIRTHRPDQSYSLSEIAPYLASAKGSNLPLWSKMYEYTPMGKLMNETFKEAERINSLEQYKNVLSNEAYAKLSSQVNDNSVNFTTTTTRSSSTSTASTNTATPEEGRSKYLVNEVATAIMVLRSGRNYSYVNWNSNDSGEVAIGLYGWTGSKQAELLADIVKSNKKAAAEILGSEKSALYLKIANKSILYGNSIAASNKNKIITLISSEEGRKVQVKKTINDAKQIINSIKFSNVKPTLFIAALSNTIPNIIQILNSSNMIDLDCSLAALYSFITANMNDWMKKYSSDITFAYKFADSTVSTQKNLTSDSYAIETIISGSNATSTKKESWFSKLFSSVETAIKAMFGLYEDNEEVEDTSQYGNTEVGAMTSTTNTDGSVALGEKTEQKLSGYLDILDDDYQYKLNEKIKALRSMLSLDINRALYLFEKSKFYSWLMESSSTFYNGYSSASSNQAKNSYLSNSKLELNIEIEFKNILKTQGDIASTDISNVEAAIEAFTAFVNYFIAFGVPGSFKLDVNSIIKGSWLDCEFYKNRIMCNKTFNTRLYNMKSRKDICEYLIKFLNTAFVKAWSDNGAFLNDLELSRFDAAASLAVLADPHASIDKKEKAWDLAVNTLSKIKDNYGSDEANSVINNFPTVNDFDFLKNDDKNYKENSIVFASDQSKNEYIEAKDYLDSFIDNRTYTGIDYSKYKLNLDDLEPRSYKKQNVYNPYSIRKLIKTNKMGSINAWYEDDTMDSFSRYAFYKRLGVKDLSKIEPNKKYRKYYDNEIDVLETYDPTDPMMNRMALYDTMYDYYGYWKQNPKNTNEGKNYHNNRTFNEYELLDAMALKRAADEGQTKLPKIRYASNPSVLDKIPGNDNYDKEYAIAKELLTPSFLPVDGEKGGIKYLENYLNATTDSTGSDFGSKNGVDFSRADAHYYSAMETATEPTGNIGVTAGVKQLSNLSDYLPPAAKGSGLDKYKYYTAGATQAQTSFINEIGEYAVAEANRRPNKWILPSVCIAQAIMESGWGKSTLMKKANAYFGIKAGSSWKGKRFSSKTHEIYNGVDTIITDAFRAYDSAAESVRDYYDLTCGASRYKKAVCNSNFISTISELLIGGYATAITYIQSIGKVYRQNKELLDSYDERVNGFNKSKQCKMSDLTDEKLKAADAEVARIKGTPTSIVGSADTTTGTTFTPSSSTSSTTANKEKEKPKSWLAQLQDGITKALQAKFGTYEQDSSNSKDSSTTTTVTYNVDYNTSFAESIVNTCESDYAAGNIKYVYGADNETELKFDCSSWVKYVFKRNGVVVPRDTASQLAASSTFDSINVNDIMPGDAVYFKTNTESLGYSGRHVGIYVGEGYYIHNAGKKYGIKKNLLSEKTDKIIGVRRLKKELIPAQFSAGRSNLFDIPDIGLDINNSAGSTMQKAVSIANKYKNSGGTDARYFSDIFGRAGMSTKYYDGSNKTSAIKSSLAKGQKVVLMGQDTSNRSKAKSPFGSGNHYVLATGIGNGKIAVNDPEQNAPRVYSDKILNNTKLGIAVSGKGSGFTSQYAYGNMKFADGESVADAGCGPAVASMVLDSSAMGTHNRLYSAAGTYSDEDKKNDAQKVANNAVSSVKNSAEDKIKSAVRTTITDNSTTIIAKFRNILSDLLEKLSKNGTVKSLFKKVLKAVGKESTEAAAEQALKTITNGIYEALSDKLVNIATRLGSSALNVLDNLVPIANILGIVAAFVDGFTNAASYMGILDEDCTAVYRFICGFGNAINSAIPVIGGIIPIDVIINIVTNVILPVLGFSTTKLDNLRTKAQTTLSDYNKKNKSNFTLQQYNERDDFDTKIKEGLSKFFGKGSEISIYGSRGSYVSPSIYTAKGAVGQLLNNTSTIKSAKVAINNSNKSNVTVEQIMRNSARGTTSNYKNIDVDDGSSIVLKSSNNQDEFIKVIIELLSANVKNTSNIKHVIELLAEIMNNTKPTQSSDEAKGSLSSTTTSRSDRMSGKASTKKDLRKDTATLLRTYSQSDSADMSQLIRDLTSMVRN